MCRERVDIVCPACGARCVFEEPFQFAPLEPTGEARSGPSWAGRRVIEKFPAEFPWTPPRDGYQRMKQGMAACPACGLRRRHALDWPQDAFWRWDVRGRALWAADRAHALEILEYVRSAQRPARRSPDLKRIPSFFLTAKNRDLVVSRIEKSLSAPQTRKGG